MQFWGPALLVVSYEVFGRRGPCMATVGGSLSAEQEKGWAVESTVWASLEISLAQAVLEVMQPELHTACK